MNHEKWMNGIEKQALKILKRDKEHYPQAFVICEDGISIIALNCDDEESKMISIKLLKDFVKQKKAVAYIVIYEGYFTEGKKDTKEILLNRQEALFISEFSQYKGSRVIVNMFTKTESGEIFMLERREIEMGNSEKYQSLWDVWENERCIKNGKKNI